MFVTAFKNTLQNLPTREAGYDAFMQSINQDVVNTSFCDPITEFFVRVTNYALNKSPPSSSLEFSPVRYYDPRIFLTAFTISRFPIEVLISPEEPLRFTVLNKAIAFLGRIDTVLHVLNPAEDDAADDFLDAETAADYLRALNEFHNAWTALFC